MASWPTFNPNVRTDLSKTQNLLNNSIGRTYEPGSTFKPVVLGISMERGSVHPNESFHCPYRIKIADGHISEAGKNGFGRLSVPEILAKSSNTGMAQIGIRVKPFNMYHSVREWDSVNRRGLNFPEPRTAFIITGAVRGCSFEYSHRAGPLLRRCTLHPQSAIANGGNPCVHISFQVVDSSGNIVYNEERQFLRTVLFLKSRYGFRERWSILSSRAQDGMAQFRNFNRCQDRYCSDR